MICIISNWYSFILFIYLIILFPVECEDNEKEEELDELYQEANMPIEEILLKYKNKIIKKSLDKSDIEDSGEEQPGSSKESEKEIVSDSNTTVNGML